MSIHEAVKRLVPDYRKLIDPYTGLRNAAITEAATTANHLLNTGLDAWNEAANILRRPHITQEYLDRLSTVFDAARVITKRSKSGQLYSRVNSRAKDIHFDVGLKWEDDRFPIPVMAESDNIFFLFFNYNPHYPPLPQYDQCQLDYLYFNERNFNQNLGVKQIDNNNRLSQLVFYWEHIAPTKLVSQERKITFYRHEKMNLPEASWVGGTFISTNSSPVY